MEKLRVLSPVAKTKTDKVQAAPRPADLSGKTIGLYWNLKGGGDIVLKNTSELLTNKYPGIKFKDFFGSRTQAIVRTVTAEDADRISKECDAIVSSTAD